MDVRQCRNCRNLYQFRGSPLCPACVQELDRLFESVRNYIYDHPQATVETICKETGAEDKMLYSWLREGRLILHKDSAKLLCCEACAKPINIGRYCEDCSCKMRNHLENAVRTFAVPPPKPAQSRGGDRDLSRMHTGGRKK